MLCDPVYQLAQDPLHVRRIDHRFPEAVAWDFMGMPDHLQRLMPPKQVTLRSAFSLATAGFLRGVDVFLFFGDWKGEEAWARSVGEAVMSGCPVIAPNRGGNLDQVIPATPATSAAPWRNWKRHAPA